MNASVESENQGLEVSERTADLIRESVSPNTLKAYRHALKKLSAWLSEGGNGFCIDSEDNGGHELERLNDSILATYITQLHDAGKSPATISQVVAAVKWRGLKYAVGEITARTLTGIRRDGKSRGRGQVSGLNRESIRISFHDLRDDDSEQALRDRVMLALMSDALLRVSELCALDVEHIDVDAQTVHIAQSKTDQLGKGAEAYITIDTLNAVKRYLDATGIDAGALFHSDGPKRKGTKCGKLKNNPRINVDALRRIIKKRTAQSDLDDFISGHSLRVGMADELAKRETSLPEIQKRTNDRLFLRLHRYSYPNAHLCCIRYAPIIEKRVRLSITQKMLTRRY